MILFSERKKNSDMVFPVLSSGSINKYELPYGCHDKVKGSIMDRE